MNFYRVTNKTYNCPDCNSDKGCEYCYRTFWVQKEIQEESFPSIYDGCKNMNANACLHCSSNPANGGSGICHCILGSFNIY